MAAKLPHILHMITPLPNVSPFDVNMALDAGFNAVIPYTNVDAKGVNSLVQDAIFSRGPKGGRKTGVFLGGRNAGLALDMLDASRKAMVPPFEVSVFADPAGSFTTAAAMVACVGKHLREKFSLDWPGCRVAVFGATGVVGYAAAVILGEEGAKVTMVGHDGIKRVKAGAEDAKTRFDVDLGYADGSSEDLKDGIANNAEVIFCAGRAGLQILTKEQISAAPDIKVVADINAVPPSGVEGIGVDDDGVQLKDCAAVAIGALAVGDIKYKVEAALFTAMIESEKPLYLDFRDAYAKARKFVD